MTCPPIPPGSPRGPLIGEGLTFVSVPKLHLRGRVSAAQLPLAETYSSWLNQVELWFNKIERDVIARGVFTSTPDLSRKLMRYIRESNKNPKPFKWSYSDVAAAFRCGPENEGTLPSCGHAGSPKAHCGRSTYSVANLCCGRVGDGGDGSVHAAA